jgi:serine/threonine protein kinase
MALKQPNNAEYPLCFLREIAVCRRVGAHPNLTTLYFVSFDYASMPCLAMPFAYGNIGVLRSMAPAAVARIMSHVLSAVEYLHSLGITHQDIHQDNVLLYDTCDPESPNARFVLGDLGISNTYTSRRICEPHMAARFHTIPPEVLVTHSYDFTRKRYLKFTGRFAECARLDMWQVGCLLASLITTKSVPWTVDAVKFEKCYRRPKDGHKRLRSEDENMTLAKYTRRLLAAFEKGYEEFMAYARLQWYVDKELLDEMDECDAKDISQQPTPRVLRRLLYPMTAAGDVVRTELSVAALKLLSVVPVQRPSATDMFRMHGKVFIRSQRTSSMSGKDTKALPVMKLCNEFLLRLSDVYHPSPPPVVMPEDPSIPTWPAKVKRYLAYISCIVLRDGEEDSGVPHTNAHVASELHKVEFANCVVLSACRSLALRCRVLSCAVCFAEFYAVAYGASLCMILNYNLSNKYVIDVARDIVPRFLDMNRKCCAHHAKHGCSPFASGNDQVGKCGAILVRCLNGESDVITISTVAENIYCNNMMTEEMDEQVSHGEGSISLRLRICTLGLLFSLSAEPSDFDGKQKLLALAKGCIELVTADKGFGWEQIVASATTNSSSSPSCGRNDASEMLRRSGDGLTILLAVFSSVSTARSYLGTALARLGLLDV